MEESKVLEEIYYKADGYFSNPVKLSDIVKAKKLNERNFVVFTNNLVKSGKLLKIDFGIVSLTWDGISTVESRLKDTLSIKRQEERERFLQKLFDMSAGDSSARFDHKNIGSAIGLDAEQSRRITELLHHRGLVDSSSGEIAITSEGISALNQ